jgi:hypothetical protein
LLTLSYIKQIDVSHDRFLIEKKDISPVIKNIPVLTLNCEKDFLEDEQNMITHAKKLNTFLIQTQTPINGNRQIKPALKMV